MRFGKTEKQTTRNSDQVSEAYTGLLHLTLISISCSPSPSDPSR